MRIFYVILIVLAVLLFTAGVICLLIRLRMCHAKGKVRNTCEEDKMRKLNEALAPFGFCYDEKNDAVCSVMYPWQREMGYCRAYDEWAFAMYMVFDCEPIYFQYNGARYLLEVWKGQYGCTTGAEIGLYVNRSEDWEKPPEKLFYECVEDDECLPMTYVLYKNGTVIQERRAVHWWLTGFCVGMFSDKEELTMEVGIGFPNAAMCSAFCTGLLRAGYERNAIRVEGCSVYFRFDKPHSKQPAVCGGWCRRRVMRRNRRNCRLYCKISKCFCTTLDKITYIGYCFPLLYRMLIRIGTKCSRRKLRKYRKHHS